MPSRQPTLGRLISAADCLSIRAHYTPMLFAIGFIFVFTVGGVTGVKVANPGVCVILQLS